MKNILLLSLFISCSMAIAMDDGFAESIIAEQIKREYHKHKICSKVKQLVNAIAIHPDIFFELYSNPHGAGEVIAAFQNQATQLANEMAHHELSTCECITYLLEIQKNNALHRVQKEFSLSSADMKKYRRRITQLEQNNADELSLHFEDSRLPVKIQSHIRDKAQSMGITIPIHITTSAFQGSYAEHFYNTGSPDYALNLNIFDLSESRLALLHRSFINPDSKYCCTTGHAIIDHELTHIKKMHINKYFELIQTIAKLHEPTEHQLLEHVQRMSKSQKKACVKLAKLHESEADRIVPSCGSCLDSFNSFIHWNNNYIKSIMNGILSPGYKKLTEKYPDLPSPEEICENDEHPHDSKRMAWAMVIYWLKTAEAQHKPL